MAGTRDVGPFHASPVLNDAQHGMKTANAAKPFGREPDLIAELLNQMLMTHAEFVRHRLDRRHRRLGGKSAQRMSDRGTAGAGALQLA